MGDFLCGMTFATVNIIEIIGFRRKNMAKDVITIGGEQRVVREDTAKSYRGVIWALLSILAFIIIATILFLGGFIGSVASGDVQSPSQIEQQRR